MLCSQGRSHILHVNYCVRQLLCQDKIRLRANGEKLSVHMAWMKFYMS